MNMSKINSKLSNVLCLVTIAVFIFTTAAAPIYGTESDVTQENSYDEESIIYSGQEYEEFADSWRFQDGYNISGDNMPVTYNLRSAFIPWSKTEDGFINSKGTVISGAIKRGVDVSAWQENVDWEKVKADDIDFAIIRCGFGSDEPGQDDAEWFRNIEECERLGIPYGVYLYSYADSKTKAKNEAKHTLRLLKEAEADPDYPVYYDLEDKITRKKDPEEIVEYAKIFCTAIEAEGYEAGIYANYDWWTNVLYDIPDDPYFDQFDKWVAQYYYRCDYHEAEYRLWQSTSDGKVDGIPGRVDLNFEFALEKETNRTTEIWKTNEDGELVYIDAEGEVAKNEWVDYRGNTYYVGEDGTRLIGRNYIGDDRYYFDKHGKLKKDSWITVSGYKYYATSDGSFETGYKKVGSYYYYFQNNGVMRKSSITVNGKQYKIFSSGKACIYSAKTTSKVNYRTGSSTSYKKKGTYKKGKIVYVTRTKNGWCRLSTGYWVDGSYLSKQTTYPKEVFEAYKVETTTKLIFRSGPATSYKKKGVFKKGKTLTIVAEKNGWGKTSGGNWIKLSYTKKI